MGCQAIISFAAKSESKVSKVLIATDQPRSFERYSKLIEDLCSIKPIIITPSKQYATIAPIMKGCYATYWKFDLINSIEDDELLLYVDADSFCLRNYSPSAIAKALAKTSTSLAAVPAQRAVLERFSALNLNSAYDYFNAGIFFS